MSSISVEVTDEKSFAGMVADELVASIQDSIDERGECCISFAGGSTPAGVYRLLGRPPRVGEIDWKSVKLFWGDERWVPRADNQSNYHMVHETFLNNVNIPDSNVFIVNTDLANPAAGAKDYSQLIEANVDSQNGCPSFDIMILGIGEDGHTASLFPGGKELKAEEWCTIAKHPESGADRVSLSLPVIRNSKKLFYIVRGEEKSDIVQAVLETERPISELPARVYAEAKGSVVWFLDSAAAKKLSKHAA